MISVPSCTIVEYWTQRLIKLSRSGVGHKALLPMYHKRTRQDYPTCKVILMDSVSKRNMRIICKETSLKRINMRFRILSIVE